MQTYTGFKQVNNTVVEGEACSLCHLAELQHVKLGYSTKGPTY